MSAAGSLASATSTRVDSASKHIQACRVNEEYMLSLLEGFTQNPNAELQHNKMKYCMHKDEIVIGLGKPKFGASIINGKNKAYPSVTTNLGRMQDVARRFLAVHNFLVEEQSMGIMLAHAFIVAMGAKDRATFMGAAEKFNVDEDKMPRAWEYIAGLSREVRSTIKEQIQNSLEHYFVGVSLGLAYAHHNSGDTVGSVMIGGLRTIPNGAFPIHTNDLLMWYFDDELPLFEKDGSRIDRETFAQRSLPFIMTGLAAMEKPSKKESLRKAYYDRANGNFGQKGGMKLHIFRIKPYIVSKHGDHFPCDKSRIWGRAISNAQPWEMVDVQISRQAI